jgi:hypothetical protein
MAPWTATIREKGKGKRLTRLRGSSPSVQGKQLMSPLYTKRPCFQKTSTGFLLEPLIPYTSEALKKENVKTNLCKAWQSIRQFSPFNCLFSIE